MLENKYPRSFDFKKWVLETPAKELKSLYDAGQCDLYFDFDIRERKVKRHSLITFSYIAVKPNNKSYWNTKAQNRRSST